MSCVLAPCALADLLPLLSEYLRGFQSFFDEKPSTSSVTSELGMEEVCKDLSMWEDTSKRRHAPSMRGWSVVEDWLPCPIGTVLPPPLLCSDCSFFLGLSVSPFAHLLVFPPLILNTLVKVFGKEVSLRLEKENCKEEQTQTVLDTALPPFPPAHEQAITAPRKEAEGGRKERACSPVDKEACAVSDLIGEVGAEQVKRMMSLTDETWIHKTSSMIKLLV